MKITNKTPRTPPNWPRANPDELANFNPNTKVCTMNCDPHIDNPRTREERLFLCDECLTIQTDTPTDRQIGLLHHTLGLRPDQREPYRNHFLAGPGHHDMPDLEALETAGLIKRTNPPSFCREQDILFCVTDAGKNLAIERLPEPPKRTRYEEYLRADCCESFAEWLGITKPEYEYSNQGVRMVRKRSTYWGFELIEGEWCQTKKEAKASYKKTLRRFGVSRRRYHEDGRGI